MQLDAFDAAVAKTGAAYHEWLAQRDAGCLDAFVSALESLLAAAPSGRKLSAAKLRRRYDEIAGEPRVEVLLRTLETDDLFEDAE